MPVRLCAGRILYEDRQACGGQSDTLFNAIISHQLASVYVPVHEGRKFPDRVRVRMPTMPHTTPPDWFGFEILRRHAAVALMGCPTSSADQLVESIRRDCFKASAGRNSGSSSTFLRGSACPVIECCRTPWGLRHDAQGKSGSPGGAAYIYRRSGDAVLSTLCSPLSKLRRRPYTI